MKDISLRRSLSERKLAKKERKDKTQSVHMERSLTPISIIGEKKKDDPVMNGGGDSEFGTLNGKKKKFWKLKVRHRNFITPAPTASMDIDTLHCSINPHRN